MQGPRLARLRSAEGRRWRGLSIPTAVPCRLWHTAGALLRTPRHQPLVSHMYIATLPLLPVVSVVLQFSAFLAHTHNVLCVWWWCCCAARGRLLRVCVYAGVQQGNGQDGLQAGQGHYHDEVLVMMMGAWMECRGRESQVACLLEDRGLALLVSK